MEEEAKQFLIDNGFEWHPRKEWTTLQKKNPKRTNGPDYLKVSHNKGEGLFKNDKSYDYVEVYHDYYELTTGYGIIFNGYLKTKQDVIDLFRLLGLEHMLNDE